MPSHYFNVPRFGAQTALSRLRRDGARPRPRLAGLVDGTDPALRAPAPAPTALAPTARPLPAPAAPAGAPTVGPQQQKKQFLGQAQAQYGVSPTFAGLGNKRLRQFLRSLYGQLGAEGSQSILGLLRQIEGRTQPAYFDPETRAARLAPQMEGIQTGFEHGQGAVTADLSARGLLGPGSEPELAFGTLEAGRRGAVAEAVREQLLREDEQRRMDEAFVAQLGQMLMGRGDKAVDISQFLTQLRMMRPESPDLLSTLGAVAGTALPYFIGPKGPR